jgi:hypothetical protein
MKRIVLTGSAPYFLNWWKDSSDNLCGYDIFSINTSVLITKDVCVKWNRSTDFFILHPDLESELKPYEDIIDKKTVYNGYEPMFDWPIHYWANDTSGTMLLNALKQMANYSFWKKDLCEICVIGCDLIYKDGIINHFYGASGTNDPIRLGKKCLIENLNMFKVLFEKLNVKIYNLSVETESLLPFDRKKI